MSSVRDSGVEQAGGSEDELRAHSTSPCAESSETVIHGMWGGRLASGWKVSEVWWLGTTRRLMSGLHGQSTYRANA